ncbi:MAG TPA: hypothetical protein VG649_10430 [Candidatus Angelobacter sp.]|nr:hypothetical protein [Candidatus Angelobacter sp.]
MANAASPVYRPAAPNAQRAPAIAASFHKTAQLHTASMLRPSIPTAPPVVRAGVVQRSSSLSLVEQLESSPIVNIFGASSTVSIFGIQQPFDSSGTPQRLLLYDILGQQRLPSILSSPIITEYQPSNNLISSPSHPEVADLPELVDEDEEESRIDQLRADEDAETELYFLAQARRRELHDEANTLYNALDSERDRTAKGYKKLQDLVAKAGNANSRKAIQGYEDLRLKWRRIHETVMELTFGNSLRDLFEEIEGTEDLGDLQRLVPIYRTKVEEGLQIRRELVDAMTELYKALLEILPEEKANIPKVRHYVIRATDSPLAGAGKLPKGISNGQAVASDIINHPTTGATGFTVRGKTVYHSSAGSSVGGNIGTAFWIVDGSSRMVVAMGRHVGGTSDQYSITWRASGVSATQTPVRLNSTTHKLQG